MNGFTLIRQLVLADFRERTRRYSFLMTMPVVNKRRLALFEGQGCGIFIEQPAQEALDHLCL